MIVAFGPVGSENTKEYIGCLRVFFHDDGITSQDFRRPFKILIVIAGF